MSSLMIQSMLGDSGGLLTIALIAGLARGLIHTTETAFIAEMYPTHARTANLSLINMATPFSRRPPSSS